MVISLDVYRCECGEDLKPHHNSTTKRNYWECPKCGALYEIDPNGPKRYKLTKYGNMPMFTVYDAFGKPLQEGNRVAWIGDPSNWKELRKGTILRIEKPCKRPRLVVKADSNPYGGWYGEGYEAVRAATLVTCRDIGGPGLRGTHFTFPRVIKL